MRSGGAGLLTCAEASSCDGLSDRAIPSASKVFILTFTDQSQQALHQEAASLIMRDHASHDCDGRAAGGGLLEWRLAPS